MSLLDEQVLLGRVELVSLCKLTIALLEHGGSDPYVPQTLATLAGRALALGNLMASTAAAERTPSPRDAILMLEHEHQALTRVRETLHGCTEVLWRDLPDAKDMHRLEMLAQEILELREWRNRIVAMADQLNEDSRENCRRGPWAARCSGDA